MNPLAASLMAAALLAASPATAGEAGGLGVVLPEDHLARANARVLARPDLLP